MNKKRIEIVALDPKYEWKKDKETNQQATANHTAKMFNQSRIQWLASDGNPANKPKEMKMTRKEAKHKLQMVGSLEADKALDMLEALGLIKFEEEEISLQEVISRARLFTNTTQEFIDRLHIGGYKIVKK